MTPARDHAARHRLRNLGLVLVGLALGALLFAVVTGRIRPAGEATTRNPARSLAPAERPLPPARSTVPTIADTPRVALEGFLAAEAARDFVLSFQFLSGEDRAAFRSAVRWTAAHPDVIFPIRRHRIEHVDEWPGQAEATAMLELHSTLDEVVGLVPARARAHFELAHEEEGWRVRFDRIAMTPLYPPESEAPAAVRRWAEARVACRDAPEYRGGLMGTPALADRLCRATGRIAIGKVDPLPEGTEAEPFLAAFGPEVGTWARLLELASPEPLRVVVAPVGSSWLVIGVLPPAEERAP